MSISQVVNTNNKAFRTTGRNSGFTLIELLVVISIIALLIGILLPALGKAKATAQGVTCMSNSRQMGLGMQQYVSDNNGSFPNHYGYRSAAVAGNQGQEYPGGWQSLSTGEHAGGAANPTGPYYGYVQWSGVLVGSSYMSDGKGLICPTTTTQGWGSTFYNVNDIGGGVNPHDIEGYQQFSGVNAPAGNIPSQAGGTGIVVGGPPACANAQVDSQAARLSYCGNEAIMPRGKSLSAFDGSLVTSDGFAGTARPGLANTKLVKIDRIDKASGTICVAEYSDSFRQLFDSSSSSGKGIKTHRPTHAVIPVTAGGSTPTGVRWDGENLVYKVTDGSAGGNGLGVGVVPGAMAISVTDATNMYASFPTNVDQTSNTGAYTFGGVAFAAGNTPFLAYSEATRHGGRANFTYVDGHAAAHSLTETLNPTDWQWGLKMYATPQQIIVQQPGSTTPVQ